MADDELSWRKSTASGANNECVEVAELPDEGQLVRDSKDRRGTVLTFTAGEWTASWPALATASSTD